MVITVSGGNGKLGAMIKEEMYYIGMCTRYIFTAIHLSLICMAKGLGGLTAIHLSLICMAKGLGGLTAMHLSLICMTVRLGWTDCHTCLLFV